MSSSTEPTSSGSQSSSAVANEVQSLRLLVHGLIMAVLVASIGLNAFLYKQMKQLQSANAVAAPKFVSAVNTFNEKESPKRTALLNELVVFAKTNPDFADILKKYPFVQNLSPAAPAK